ncbi:MAG TPA: beta-N-acetylhexosaminidase, partial [Gammaproteobacteria bacterium]|nr:beta-N-acetylhexosaminidase [Gammaproteobacteria bacterium]
MPHGPVMIDLKGFGILPIEEEILKHPMVCGVILFAKNCQNTEQLKGLIAKVRKLRPEILFAVDREGGHVQRFQKSGFRAWPAARAYGEMYDHYGSGIAQDYTERQGTGIGEELSELGIDINFAPVLDLHSDNEVIGGLDRAFHSDSKTCAEIAEWIIRGMKSKGVKVTGKHFPTHSVCVEDSHEKKPVSDIDEKTLFEKHLLVYQILIEKKLLDVIMMAHITYTAVDSENPAGFSKIWIGILRERLGFKGVLATDCLSMKGADVDNIKDLELNIKARVLKALHAECDIALLCNQPPELLLKVLNALKQDFTPN